MALLTREQILQADDSQTRTVQVPEWGGEVLVKSLTGLERGIYQSRLIDQRKGGRTIRLEQVQIQLCALTMVDESGKRLFSDQDMKHLANKSAMALQRVFDVAAELCGLSEDDIEEMVKNSDAILSDDSPSS